VLAVANRGITSTVIDSLVTRQVDSLRTTDLSDAELAKAKNMVRARFIRSRETAQGRAETLQHFNMFHQALAELNTDLDRYLAVTAADVRRVARTYLDSANVVDLIVEPAAGDGREAAP
jgi:predicted Zn-dependent peptidase